MILKKIQLKNIRSYRDKSVEFSDGTTLISGDIGSGKSTILLAIEFGLFGITPGISYSDILRRGANEGEIRLSFQIGNDFIEVERKLKKGISDPTIKQLPGTITINGTTQILTASEMKSRIEEILAYPQSHKNLLYRFSVYTPQESMKLILFEDEEDRLNVIRKIFGLDKYKTVKDNITIVSRSIRNKIKINEELSKGIDEDKKRYSEEQEKLKSYKSKSEDLNRIISEIERNHINVLNKIKDNETRKKVISEKKEKILVDIEKIRLSKKDLENIRCSIITYQNDLNNLEKQKENLLEQIKLMENTPVESIDILKKRSDEISKEINENENKKKSVSEKIIFLEKQSKSLSDEITRITSELEKKSLEIKGKQEILEKISSENSMKDRMITLSDELNEIRMMISNFSAKKDMLSSSTKNISGLDTCPTCKQLVTSDHKHRIETETKEKIDYIDKTLIDRTSNEKRIVNEQKSLENQLREIFSLKERLKYIEKSEKDIENIKKSLSEKNVSLSATRTEITENRELFAILDTFNRKEKESEKHSIEESIRNIQRRKEIDIKIANILERITEKKIDIAISKEKSEDREKIISEEKSVLKESENIASEENIVNENLSTLKTDESIVNQDKTKMTSEKSALLKDIEYTNKIIQEIQNKISEKERIQKETLKAKSNNEFLTSRLVPVIDHIEKTMLREINERLNNHFSKWFDILMEDEEISARINDNFTPIVTVQGHDADVNSLSGGEKTSLALAYRLSINKVINELVSGIKTKDLIILDEPTDGFSSEQLDKMKDVLDNLNLKQILIVSHESKIESFVQNIIRLQKTNHTTDIV